MQSNYEKYRGKCKEYVDKAILADSTLTAVRGWYMCPIWGEQQHWWCVDKDGKVIDPTRKQFPSQGIGEYVPFNGIITCSECGKEVPEEEALFDSNYAFCSGRCHACFIGMEEFI